MFMIHNDINYDIQADALCGQAFNALVEYRNALRNYYYLDNESIRSWARERVLKRRTDYTDICFECAYWLHGHLPLKQEHNYPLLSSEEVEEHEREDFFDKYGYYPEKIS